MESTVFDLFQAGICVDLIVGYDVHHEAQCGVRLRTFGKSLPKDRMVIAMGETFAEGLDNAVQKARAGRWEHLEWAARPWPIAVAGAGAGSFGI